MSRLLNPKVYDDQNSIIAQKYNAGWKVRVIAGYIGISISLVWARLEVLERKGQIERRISNGN